MRYLIGQNIKIHLIGSKRKLISMCIPLQLLHSDGCSPYSTILFILNSEIGKDWPKQIEDAILEKLGDKHGVVHIAVDTDSDEVGKPDNPADVFCCIVKV